MAHTGAAADVLRGDAPGEAGRGKAGAVAEAGAAARRGHGHHHQPGVPGRSRAQARPLHRPRLRPQAQARRAQGALLLDIKRQQTGTTLLLTPYLLSQNASRSSPGAYSPKMSTVFCNLCIRGSPVIRGRRYLAGATVRAWVDPGGCITLRG